MNDIANELSFMEYAERTVYEFQRLFRTKVILENYPVIGILLLLLHYCFLIITLHHQHNHHHQYNHHHHHNHQHNHQYNHQHNHQYNHQHNHQHNHHYYYRNELKDGRNNLFASIKRIWIE